MSGVFVDTSAIVAYLDADEAAHGATKASWLQLLESDEPLFTSNYVLVECHALIQSRLGMDAVRVLTGDVLPLIETIWVDAEVHRVAVSSLLAASRRRLSLVDCSSFEVMRRRGLTRALALDRHFAEQAFEVLPGRR